jgi:hypothetical protein
MSIRTPRRRKQIDDQKADIQLEVIAQYEHSKQAVEHILKLFVSYLLSNVDTTRLAEKSAPCAIMPCEDNDRFRVEGFRVEGFRVEDPRDVHDGQVRAIACFDIDDTILHDSDSSSGIEPNFAVLQLLHRLFELNVDIHLITARRDDKEMRTLTLEELHGKDPQVNVKGMYKSLSMAPEKERDNMSTISRWKMKCRKSIAQYYKCPITVSVGDQWGDCLVLNSDDDLDKLDDIVGVKDEPYVVMRPHDKVSLWALKLRALE